jgi:hypothetical protein
MSSKRGVQDQIRGIQNRPVLEHRVKAHGERFDVTDVRGNGYRT